MVAGVGSGAVRLAAGAELTASVRTRIRGSTPLRRAPNFCGMSPAEAQQRIAELRAKVAHHEALYRKKAQPEISDFDFDQLADTLAALERQFPQFATVDSPTRQIGDDRTEGFARVKHRQGMTTLDKTYDEADLREFHARLAKVLGTDDLAYTVEPKIDGVAVSLTYERGKLTRAVTRGDGEEGRRAMTSRSTCAPSNHCRKVCGVRRCPT
jgi:NAD-dependent DNA ligase